MVTITVDEAMQATFAPLNQEAQLCDVSGRVLGYFMPRRERERRLLEAAKKHIDPKEVERRSQYNGAGFTTKEVLDHLRSLEPS